MGVIIMILVVIAALLVVVSGIWVAIALVAAVSARRFIPDTQSRANEQSLSERLDEQSGD